MNDNAVAPMLMTIPEAAAALNVPEGWLRKKVTALEVPHTRLGKHVRFTLEHLRAIAHQGEVAILCPRAQSSGLSPRVRHRLS